MLFLYLFIVKEKKKKMKGMKRRIRDKSTKGKKQYEGYPAPHMKVLSPEHGILQSVSGAVP